MTQISAADQHVILTKEGKWRLAYQERPLAEASVKGFRYGSRFGRTRRLPEDGVISQNDILQVMLGWQATDESWHLGLILAPTLADQRGSRWCEIVHWPDPEISVFQDLAQQSGQELAQALGVPFYVIPPQDAKPPEPTRELPKLPLSFGHWQMEALAQDQGHYIIRRKASFVRERVSRMAWYGFWAVVYLVISIATIFGDIALPVTGTLIPNPQVLPYLGIGIAFVLFVGILLQFVAMVTSVDRIVIDGSHGTVSAWNNRDMRWSVPLVEMQSVYVSEVVKKREQAPATEYGELNLHLGGGKFQFLAQHEQQESNSNIPQPERVYSRTSGVRELDREVVHTELQAVAMYIAEAIGDLPVWYDLRLK